MGTTVIAIAEYVKQLGLECCVGGDDALHVQTFSNPDGGIQLRLRSDGVLLSSDFRVPFDEPFDHDWRLLLDPEREVGEEHWADFRSFGLHYEASDKCFRLLYRLIRKNGLSELDDLGYALVEFDKQAALFHKRLAEVIDTRSKIERRTPSISKPSETDSAGTSKQQGQQTSSEQRIVAAAALANLGRDLLELARGLTIAPEYVRHDLLARLMKLISGTRRQVLLVGEPGTGKSALVHALAAAIADDSGEIARYDLTGRRIYECTPDSFSVSCFYAHEFETKINLIAKQCLESEAILFIDKIEGAVTAGRVEDRADRTLANMLAPTMQRNETSVIGATTPAGLKFMRNDTPAFVDLFHILEIPEPSTEEVSSIVLNRIAELELLHEGLRFDTQVAPAVISLSDRFLKGRKFPAKALEVLNELVDTSEPVVEQGQVISAQDVVEAMLRRTGLRREMISDELPLSRTCVVDDLTNEVIDQDEAVATAADVILQIKAEMTQPGKPLASMMFCGPTGVGKTQLAKAMSSFLYGQDRRLLRYDMSEFSGGDGVYRLCGDKRAKGDPGRLVSDMRAYPASIVLFDEIEKAHPDVHNLLLQVLDAARLTSPTGETVSFDNAVLVLTSNVGSELFAGSLGFRDSAEQKVGRNAMLQALERRFSPEFINRLSHVVLFQSLSRGAVEQIALREVGRMNDLSVLKRRRVEVQADTALLARLIEDGYEPRYGARAMQRAVMSLVGSPVSQILAENPLLQNARVRVLWEDGPVCEVKEEALESLEPEAPCPE